MTGEMASFPGFFETLAVSWSRYVISFFSIKIYKISEIITHHMSQLPLYTPCHHLLTMSSRHDPQDEDPDQEDELLPTDEHESEEETEDDDAIIIYD